MALRDIKDKIASVKQTAKVTKAMESVSAVKMRKAQLEAIQARGYTHASFTILKRLASVSKLSLSQVFDFHKKDSGKTAVVLITSSKGLAGALNTNVFKKISTLIDEKKWDTENTDFICVGKKGTEFIRRNKFNVVYDIADFNDDDAAMVLHDISGMCLDMFHKQDYKEVCVVYTNFITTTEQKAVSRVLLPIVYDDLHDFIHEIIPKAGRYSNITDEDLDTKVDWTKEYLYEPDAAQLITDLVPHLMYIGLYYSLLESKASEHSARMLAMKNATDKAGEVAQDLNRVYNKARQAAITKEISEIVSGMETAG